MKHIFSNLNIQSVSLIIFGISFIINYVMTPKLIEVILFKNLMDNPNVRSSHTQKVPALGGLNFYVSLMLCLFFIQQYDTAHLSFNLVAGATILFVVGLKDDLVVLSAISKIVGQLLAISFVLINFDLLFVSFHGFLGIEEVPVYVSILLEYIILLAIINTYNLIDGIDGLAAMIGIFILTIYSIIFYYLGMDYYLLLSVICIGFLLAFLRFNISDKNKIFMGDTGSMLVGFIIGILTLRFFALTDLQLEKLNILPENIFWIALAILFFPITDVIRVVLIRLLNAEGPFSPDRRHLHHIFIDNGLSHVRASITITIISISIFLTIFFLNTNHTYVGLALLLSILTILSYSVLIILDKDAITRRYRKKFKSMFPKLIINNEFILRKKIIIFVKTLFFKDLL